MEKWLQKLELEFRAGKIFWQTARSLVEHCPLFVSWPQLFWFRIPGCAEKSLLKKTSCCNFCCKCFYHKKQISYIEIEAHHCYNNCFNYCSGINRCCSLHFVASRMLNNRPGQAHLFHYSSEPPHNNSGGYGTKSPTMSSAPGIQIAETYLEIGEAGVH